MSSKIPTKRSGKSSKALPEVQQRLENTLQNVFSGKILSLPAHAWEGFGLTVRVRREDAREVFSALRETPEFLFNMLIDITAVDWLGKREPRFDVVYQLLSLSHLHRLCVKVELDEETASTPSVRELWPAANFLEREVFDMYGIQFEEHGDLRRILMYDEFVGHPLRKDYPLRGKQPRIPLRVPELRNDSEDMVRQELVALPSSRRRAAKPEKDSL